MKAIVLCANITLGWKLMSLANTVGYFDAATITAVKSLIVPALGSQSKKRFD